MLKSSDGWEAPIPESGITASSCTVPDPAPAWTFGPGPELVSGWAADARDEQGATAATGATRGLPGHACDETIPG